VLITTWTSLGDPLLQSPLQQKHHSPPHCAHIHCLVSMNIQKASAKIKRCHFFPPGGLQQHTFASYTLPCQILFCQTAPLRPSVVTLHQNVTEYHWGGSNSTAIPPTSTSDIVSQHNKIGSITFRAALAYGTFWCVSWVSIAAVQVSNLILPTDY